MGNSAISVASPRFILVCGRREGLVFFKMVALHISGLAGPSQFLNGTHEFSELLVARIVLLVDQSRSVLPLRSAKAREFGKLW